MEEHGHVGDGLLGNNTGQERALLQTLVRTCDPCEVAHVVIDRLDCIRAPDNGDFVDEDSVIVTMRQS